MLIDVYDPNFVERLRIQVQWLSYSLFEALEWVHGTVLFPILFFYWIKFALKVTIQSHVEALFL